MKKRLISLSACLCLIAQLFVVNVSADQGASVLSSEISDGIAKVIFSDALNDEAIDDITVQDENGKDFSQYVIVDVDDDTLTADVTSLPIGNSEYKIHLPQELGLTAAADVTITRKDGGSFSDDLSNVSKWCCVGNYNDSMFNKPHTADPAATAGAMRVDKFTAPKDFPTMNYSNETLEFDYSFINMPAANCDGFFAALLRTEDVHGTNGYTPLTKAYALHFMNNGGQIVARILRMDDEDIHYMWSAWSDRMQWANANLDLKANTPVRFKMEAQNTDAGVTIAVYMAEYTDGVLGEYTKIMQGTDALSKYKSGYFAFIGDASTGNVVDNVKLSTKTAETITVTGAEPEYKNLDVMKEWAEQRLAQTGKDKLTFVALGGSITQMAGWTEMVTEFFNEKMGVDVELVNSGIGGTGSDYANMRLFDDCISKNPDVVFLDHAVNDYPGWTYWAGKLEYTTQFETIVRRLMQLENPPMIYGVHFTTRKALIGDYQLEQNAGIGDKTPGTGDGTLRVMPKDEFNQILDYYNIPNIDIHDYIKSFTTYKGGKLTFDYNDPRISSFFDGARNSTASVTGGYTYKSAIEAGDIAALLYDYVHPSPYAKNVYGQYMIDQMSKNKNCTFRDAEFKIKPFINADFSGFNPKVVDISADIIKNSARFTVTGDANIYDNPNGLKDPAEKCVIVEANTDTTIKYTFYGNVYGIFTNTALTLDPAIILRADGKEILQNNTNYLQLNKMLSNAGKHTAEIIIPAGKRMSIWRIMTDEENFIGYNAFTDKNGQSVVSIDLANVANSRGFKTKAQYSTNLGWQGILNLPWQDSQNHSDQYETLNYQFMDQDWFVEKGYIVDGKLNYAGSSTTYDVKNLLNNARYKALSTAMSPSVYAGDICTDKITILGAKNTPNTALMVSLTYADGTVDTKTIDMTPSLLAQKTLVTPWGASNSSWGLGVMYELTIDADASKKLSSISFFGSNNKAEDDAMQILGINLYPTEKVGNAYAELKDGNGFVVNNISDVKGNSVTADVCLYNLTGNDKAAKVVFAIYNDGKLAGVSFENVNFAGEKYKNVEVEVPVTTALSASSTAKVFIWDDDMITSLSNAINF